MNSQEIKSIMKEGRFFNLPSVRGRYKKGKVKDGQIAVIVSGKLVKKAVARNKLRRQVREWVRRNKFAVGNDLVLLLNKTDIRQITGELKEVKIN